MGLVDVLTDVRLPVELDDFSSFSLSFPKKLLNLALADLGDLLRGNVV